MSKDNDKMLYSEKNRFNPCIGVCSINPEDGYCYGCKRTEDEIENWIFMEREEIDQCLAELEQRHNVDD